jgi:hypothetical protein
MRVLFVFIFIISCNFAVAQEQNYFNYNYSLGNEVQCNSMGLVRLDSTFFTYGGIGRITNDCGYERIGYHLTKINSLGERDTSLMVDSCGYILYSGWQGSITSHNDTILVIGDEAPVNSEYRIFIGQFNSYLDTLSVNYYFEDTLTKRARSLSIDNNGNILFFGGIDSSYNEITNPTPDTIFSKGLIFKTNMDGETIWSQSYAWGTLEDGCWNVLRKGLTLFDNSIAATGVSNDFSSNSKPIILKTDSLGNEEWVHAYGSNTYSNPRFMDIIETRDSSILLCGAFTYGETFGGLYPYDGWLLKLNPDGTTVWNRKYREHTVNNSDWRDTIYCEFVSITELDDGGLAAIARVRSTDCPCKDFKLYRMNSFGDTLWTKAFSSYPDGNILYYPNSILQTADGGFAISGYEDYYEWSDSSGWVSSQRIFLIKTDSLGNDSLVHISEPQATPISRYELEVYPNPVGHQLHINLPANFPGGDMQVINQQGQIVSSTHLPRHKQSPAELNVSSYPPGHYLVQIKTGKNYYYGKFVKN